MPANLKFSEIILDGQVVTASGNSLIVNGIAVGGTAYGAGTGIFIDSVNNINTSGLAYSSSLTQSGANLYGYIIGLSGNNSSVYATIANLGASGSQLYSDIIGLSGNSAATFATISNLALSGSNLYNDIVGLSGWALLTFSTGGGGGGISFINGTSNQILVSTIGSTSTLSLAANLTGINNINGTGTLSIDAETSVIIGGSLAGTAQLGGTNASVATLVQGTNQAGLAFGSFLPSPDNTLPFGSSSERWKELFVGGAGLRIGDGSVGPIVGAAGNSLVLAPGTSAGVILSGLAYRTNTGDWTNSGVATIAQLLLVSGANGNIYATISNLQNTGQTIYNDLLGFSGSYTFQVPTIYGGNNDSQFYAAPNQGSYINIFGNNNSGNFTGFDCTFGSFNREYLGGTFEQLSGSYPTTLLAIKHTGSAIGIFGDFNQVAVTGVGAAAFLSATILGSINKIISSSSNSATANTLAGYANTMMGQSSSSSIFGEGNSSSMDSSSTGNNNTVIGNINTITAIHDSTCVQDVTVVGYQNLLSSTSGTAGQAASCIFGSQNTLSYSQATGNNASGLSAQDGVSIVVGILNTLSDNCAVPGSHNIANSIFGSHDTFQIDQQTGMNGIDNLRNQIIGHENTIHILSGSNGGNRAMSLLGHFNVLTYDANNVNYVFEPTQGTVVPNLGNNGTTLVGYANNGSNLINSSLVGIDNSGNGNALHLHGQSLQLIDSQGVMVLGYGSTNICQNYTPTGPLPTGAQLQIIDCSGFFLSITGNWTNSGVASIAQLLQISGMGGGSGATYAAGTGIFIDAANNINIIELPAVFGGRNDSTSSVGTDFTMFGSYNSGIFTGNDMVVGSYNTIISNPNANSQNSIVGIKNLLACNGNQSTDNVVYGSFNSMSISGLNGFNTDTNIIFGSNNKLDYSGASACENIIVDGAFNIFQVTGTASQTKRDVIYGYGNTFLSNSGGLTASSLFGVSNSINVNRGESNAGFQLIGDANTVKIVSGGANTNSVTVGIANTISILSGFGNSNINVFGDSNQVNISGNLNSSINLIGATNQSFTSGGMINDTVVGVGNIIGNVSHLSVFGESIKSNMNSGVILGIGNTQIQIQSGNGIYSSITNNWTSSGLATVAQLTQVSGALAAPAFSGVFNITANYSGVGETFVTFSGNSPITYSLPSAASMNGKQLIIKQVATGALAINAVGGDSIFNTSSVTTLSGSVMGASYTLMCTPGMFYVV